MESSESLNCRSVCNTVLEYCVLLRSRHFNTSKRSHFVSYFRQFAWVESTRIFASG